MNLDEGIENDLVTPVEATCWGEGYAYKTGKENGYLAGYAAAIADAVESVKNLLPITDPQPIQDPENGTGMKIIIHYDLCSRDLAVEAIKSLHGDLI